MSMPARDVVDGITLALDGEVPELDLAASELARRAIRFASMLEDTLTASLAPWGLTPADYGVLITLRSAGEPYELRPSELKSRLLMTSGGVSGVLNRLDKTGLIDRQPHPTDGRSSRVRLTSTGLETVNAAVRAWTLAQCDVLRKVPDEVNRSAADALREVLLALGDSAPQSAQAPGRHGIDTA